MSTLVLVVVWAWLKCFPWSPSPCPLQWQLAEGFGIIMVITRHSSAIAVLCSLSAIAVLPDDKSSNMARGPEQLHIVDVFLPSWLMMKDQDSWGALFGQLCVGLLGLDSILIEFKTYIWLGTILITSWTEFMSFCDTVIGTTGSSVTTFASLLKQWFSGGPQWQLIDIGDWEGPNCTNLPMELRTQHRSYHLHYDRLLGTNSRWAL